MLELRNLVKHYPSPDGKRIKAVDGISLQIAAGDLAALYGPSGSGKSTLLLMIAALLAPDSGVILVGGRDVSALSARDAARYRRLELGFVRQELDVIEGATAIDNATLKLLDARVGRREARKRVEPLLVELGLKERLKHRAERLSMGERQRVLIARALSTGPALVLADEPTGSLDGQRSHEVLTLLSDLCRERGVAMLLATHDPQAAAFAAHAWTLHDGRLREATVATGQPVSAG
ncbi:MAG TPA: ATP-binding cassette domain-containing protein [Conexibacter sp.]|jgi:ABC-type lipoprotein export system ATPase subunit